MIVPVGFVHGGRTEPQDDNWDAETCQIRLTDRYTPAALTGIEAFSG